jgi:hypothetical protein
VLLLLPSLPFFSDFWFRVLFVSGLCTSVSVETTFYDPPFNATFLARFSWSSSLVQTPTYSWKACCTFLFEASLLRQEESIVSTLQRGQITCVLFQQKLLIRHKPWKSYLWVAILSKGINLRKPTMGCTCAQKVSVDYFQKDRFLTVLNPMYEWIWEPYLCYSWTENSDRMHVKICFTENLKYTNLFWIPSKCGIQWKCENSTYLWQDSNSERNGILHSTKCKFRMERTILNCWPVFISVSSSILN